MKRMAVRAAWWGLVCGVAAVSSLQAHSDVLPLQRLNSVPNGPVLVVLPLGEFEMGAALARTADDQTPAHRVRVTQPIAMSTTEITTAQYMACVNDRRNARSASGKRAPPACDPPQWQQAHNEFNLKTGSDASYRPLVGPDQPVVGVSWFNAQQYTAWLSAKTGHLYRLPTEAEWEYACRAGEGTFLCGREALDRLSWHYGNSQGKTHPVATKAPNAWGLYDMNGNAWEWTADCYHEASYVEREQHNAHTPNGAWPAHRTSEEQANCARVLRGGAWDSSVRYLHPSFRSSDVPDMRDPANGFRVVRELR